MPGAPANPEMTQKLTTIKWHRRYPRRNEPWSLKELKLLGKIPDSALARRLKRTISEVIAQRERRRIALPTPPRDWTTREIRLLGRFNDREVGRRLRRSAASVSYTRNRLGIAPFIRHAQKKWTRRQEKLLGTMP